MGLHLLTRDDATVLRDVAAPAAVVITSGGVYVVLDRREGNRADLREHVRTVREHLDAAGLRALPAEGLLCVSESGDAARRTGTAVVGDLDAINLILLLACEEKRFGRATVGRAIAAMSRTPAVTAPPWIAKVAEAQPEPEPAPRPAAPARR